MVRVILTPHLAKTSTLLFLDDCREKDRETDKERVIYIERYVLLSSLLLGGEGIRMAEVMVSLHPSS